MSDVNSTTSPARTPLPKQVKDIRGQKFGKLVVNEFAGFHLRYAAFTCTCQCGNEVVVSGKDLRGGRTRSCGCLRKDVARSRPKSMHRLTHGLSHTPIERVWHAMKRRCTNPNSTDYSRYGGRGIRVCERWLHSVEAFVADMGPRPSSNHSIERIDNGGNYEPGNCRWATSSEQARNRRSSCMIEYRGECKAMAAWLEEYKISYKRFYRLIKGGASKSDAFAAAIKYSIL